MCIRDSFKNRLETIPTKYASTMAQLTDPAEAHDILHLGRRRQDAAMNLEMCIRDSLCSIANS